MKRTVKFKLYPNKEAKKLLESWLSTSLEVWNRFALNDYLAYRKNKTFHSAYTNKKILTEIKNTENKYFDINRSVLNNVLFRLEEGYKSTFTKWKKNAESIRKGKGIIFENVELPKPKDYYNILEFGNGYSLDLNNRKFHISKIGTGVKGYLASISFRGKSKYLGTPAKEVIIQKKDNTWYLCLSYEIIPQFKQSEKEVGLDWGIATFLTRSDEVKHNIPKFISDRELNHKKSIQRETKQQNHKSNRYERNLGRIRKINDKVRCRKIDFYDKLSLNLVAEIGTFCIEDLNLQELQSRKLHHGKSMNNQSSSIFFERLENQAEKHSCQVVKVNPYLTSKTCNYCGYVNYKLTERNREWDCPSCNNHLDRDINAARNILDLGIFTSRTGVYAHEVKDGVPTIGDYFLAKKQGIKCEDNYIQ